MEQSSVKIVNKRGLHARASAQLARKAAAFGAVIQIGKNGVFVNARSIMGLMMLGAAKGDVIDIRTEGADEQDAIGQVISLVESGFGEDD